MEAVENDAQPLPTGHMSPSSCGTGRAGINKDNGDEELSFCEAHRVLDAHSATAMVVRPKCLPKENPQLSELFQAAQGVRDTYRAKLFYTAQGVQDTYRAELFYTARVWAQQKNSYKKRSGEKKKGQPAINNVAQTVKT
ncbi:hypothetical protein A6R68_20210 [Neotoma lepida]|uniref:Uncharacterized protein n=1 Tax=Neotoma lepida TaxID=56216 RepID=A0A1A6HUA3_NEOLE|nr:hypothetical protein A6R68_20210 [Neotoma lepida]